MLHHFKRILKPKLSDSNKADSLLSENPDTFFALNGLDFNTFTNHVLDNMTEMVWAKDLVGRYIYSNKVHNETFLFTLHSREAIGHDHTWFAERQRKEAPERNDWHTFDLDCSDSDQQIIKTGIAGRFIETGYVKGEKLVLDVYKSPIRNTKGEIIGVVGSARNISHQTLIEEELASSRIQHEAILSAIPDMMYLFDENGNFINIHIGAEEKINNPFCSFNVKNIKDFFDEEFANDTIQKIRQCLSDGQPFTTKFKLNILNNTFHYEARHVRISQNKVLAISRDITEMLVHEKSSRQRQKLMKAINLANSELLINQELSDSIPIAFEIIGTNSEIDLIHFFQLSDKKSDLQEYHLQSVWKKEKEFSYITAIELHLFNLAEENDIVTNSDRNEFSYIRSSTVANANLHPLLQAKGIKSYAVLPVKSGLKTIGLLVFASCRSNAPFDEATLDTLSTLAVSIGGAATRFETETHLKQVLKKVEASNLLKNNLLRNISHELRTPLNGIQGFTDLLASENLDPFIMDLVHQIKKSSKRFTSTLHNLMMLSQLEDESECPKSRPLDLNLVFNQLITELDEATTRNNNQIRIYNNIDRPLILIEPYLTQVLNHLLDNAVKFTQNGIIEIHANIIYKESNKVLQIKITDSGIGIEPEHLDIIFEPFRQVSEGTTRNYEGSGIGLTIAKKLASSMDAEINVISQIEKGSTFFLTIPVNEEAIDQPVLNHQDQPSKSKNKPLVLVVEDNVVNANLVKLYLEDYCEIVIVRSFNESIKALSQFKFQAILLDIHLGNGPDGLEIVKELKKKPNGENIPVIAVSGFDTMMDKIKCSNEGINYYLTKPFSKKQIIQLLSSLKII